MPTTGYPYRILAVARRFYYWPTMRVDIDKYLAQCIQLVSQQGKPLTTYTRG